MTLDLSALPRFTQGAQERSAQIDDDQSGKAVPVFATKVYGGVKVWFHNYELYEIFNDSNVVNYIKAKRMAWAGHLMRMNNDRTKAKKIFNTKPDGVRRVGRPKMPWEDGVNQDLKMLEVKNWKKVALDGDELAKLLKEIRAHQGLSNQ